MLSPVINAHANLADVDCMAAADPDACIAQLTDIAANTAAEPAPVATTAAESTPANSGAATTDTSKPTKPAKPATVKSQPTKPKKSISAKPAASTTNKSATAPSSTETSTATDTQLATAASAETSTTTAEQPTPAPTPKPVKHVVKKPQPHPATTSTSPAVTLAGTPAPQAASVSASPTAQPTVTLAGTSATPAPQPKPPVYMTATSPEPVKPDLIADTMNCQKTPDPDQCVRNLTQKQGTPANFNPKNLPLNSDALGWSGPVKAALRYDSELSWILGLDYVQMLSESVGLSVKTGFGPNERRANITTGFAVTPDQHVKLTYEYLTQNLNFDFVTGGVQEWVDQHAIGGAYQYLLRREILHSFEISGYTVRANSKDLSDVIYNVQTSGDQTTSYDVNNRRIAGGTENTIQAALNLLPIKNTALTIGGGFSSLSYDTKYEDNQAKSTIAYQAQLTHLLTDTAKFVAGVNSSASGTTHSAEIRHILPKNIELSLKGEYMSSTTLPNSSSVTLGISYPAPKAYSIAPFGGMQELKNWIEKPIVYKTRVLAIKDERTIHVQPTSDSFIQTIYTSNPGNQTPDITKIIPIPMTTMFTFQDPGLTINYQCSVTSSPQLAITTCADLNLAVGIPPSAQTTQLYSTASVPAGAADPDTAYSITITATGTRPGLANPIVEIGTLTLHVYNLIPTFTDGEIDFDTTGGADQPTAPLAVTVKGLHHIDDGIDLTTASNGSGTNRSFAFFDTANPPAFWQILRSSTSPYDYYLLRNLDTQGQLNANDVGTTVPIDLCVYENNDTSQCVKATINVEVKANNTHNTSDAGTVSVNIPTPFQLLAGTSVANGWDFSLVSRSELVSTEVGGSTPITIPIADDVYSGWTTPSLTPNDWGTLSFSSGSYLVNSLGSATDITAPNVLNETLYNGTFDVSSKAKEGLVGTTNTSFAVLVTETSVPMIWDTTPKSIRFDLTNDTNIDPGLGLQGNEQVIDLSAMVKDSGGVIVPNTTFTWEVPSNPLVPNWKITPCPADSSHWCLFRALRTSGSTSVLEAGDIGQKAPNLCANAGSSQTCQTAQNFTVLPDTLGTNSASGGTNGGRFIQGIIATNNPLAELCSSSTLGGYLKQPYLYSYFVGKNLTLNSNGQTITGSTAIRINNDIFSSWTSFVSSTPGTDPYWSYWESVPTLDNATGALSGKTKFFGTQAQISSTGNYTFSVVSKAIGGVIHYGPSGNMFFSIKVISPCV